MGKDMPEIFVQSCHVTENVRLTENSVRVDARISFGFGARIVGERDSRNDDCLVASAIPFASKRRRASEETHLVRLEHSAEDLEPVR
jgi:hypothetical protein